MSEYLSIEEITRYVLDHCPGTVQNENWGERGLFYNPDHSRPKGVYLLTFKEKDGANDRASHIDRGGLYRLNLGIGKPAYQQLFGVPPKRPAAGAIVDTGHDFTKLDTIMPHPVYGWMSWIAILNPSRETFDQLKPLIQIAYQACVKKWG